MTHVVDETLVQKQYHLITGTWVCEGRTLTERSDRNWASTDCKLGRRVTATLRVRVMRLFVRLLQKVIHQTCKMCS
jgi:hypothetical protein